MKEILIDILMLAYGSVAVVEFVAYWPTIKDLYLLKSQSANKMSYILWTFSTGITFLYSIFILPDLLFQIVSGVNFLPCLLILILIIRFNKKKEKTAIMNV